MRLLAWLHYMNFRWFVNVFANNTYQKQSKELGNLPCRAIPRQRTMDSGPKTVGTALEGLQFEGWKAGLIPRA
jgi:hypothetical protein